MQYERGFHSWFNKNNNLLFGGSDFTSINAFVPIDSDFSTDFRDSYFPDSYSKMTTAFTSDGVGDRPIFPRPLLITTTDTIPGDISTTRTLTVGAPHTISTIDTIGDQDYYAVTLTAGVQYQIGMYGYVGGPSLTSLSDSYIEIYDALGNLITSGDGGANTPANDVNSGFDVLLDYTPQVSGTYYINARAYDNIPADGTNGDLIGDYEVFVQVAPPNSYQPYYDVDSPLHSIDWGSQVNRVNKSARNPDGNEGTRDTDNVQGTPVLTNSVDIAALATAQGVNVTGKNVITIYFARAGDVFTSLEDPASPGLPPATITATGVQAFERNAVFTSLAEFSKVADVVYIEVDNRDHADFVYTSYQGTPGPGVSLLGSMAPPDEANEGLAQFNSGDERWNALNLQQGGFSFVTLIHEFGHGHGLAHPHDNGGRSGIMRGVEAEGAGVADYTTGDFGLNQAIHTMMSYEDGWQQSPYGNAPTNVGYGYLGGLMAFDIAAIQDKYGVNEEWATGDDTYTLKDVNAAGTYYSSIWDGGGTDQIVYSGSRDANIDLRAATLQYEFGGGGRVSFATGIYGGFTVANGVTIENASGGSGNDTLNGNDVANILSGGDGNDMLYGFGGNDTLVGGLGNDLLDGGSGTDILQGGDGFDTLRISASSAGSRFDGGAGTDTLDVTGAVSLTGSMTGIEVINLQPGSNLTLTQAQFAALPTNLLLGGAGTVTINLSSGSEFAAPMATASGGSVVTFAISGSASDDVVKGFRDFVNNIEGGDGSDLLRGGALADIVNGGNGDDKIEGAGGADILTGGSGADVFRYQSTNASGIGAGADRITDFVAGQDKLGFGLIDADPVTPGDQGFAFIGTGAFGGTGAAQIRYGDSGGNLLVQADVNGDGVVDMEIILQGLAGQTLGSGDFVL